MEPVTSSFDIDLSYMLSSMRLPWYEPLMSSRRAVLATRHNLHRSRDQGFVNSPTQNSLSFSTFLQLPFIDTLGTRYGTFNKRAYMLGRGGYSTVQFDTVEKGENYESLKEVSVNSQEEEFREYCCCCQRV
jgi:hypothetical protein